ncbi:polysaccharide deacetylase family protein [Merismopedia glauca]|uniref:Chitooligosaccharide deacetylase NodB-like protein n=1 Tax=Merismopedia glauca CCAP 1448/3 TaxID=1296344 RepID=A0A2T1BY40_9CYAN|nr:polysaccharide deacetylase family protein [Merismopedia glauca]PSB00921.1 chitooligosaccharide deacetylase NodB-like protein [Merismopedia glauca CCAP 1448/3]
MPLAYLTPVLYRCLKPIFPQCLWSGSRDEKVVALTFDDGPHPQYTSELLKVLDKYQVPATFFWLGVCVERSPKVALEVYHQKHQIGLHGYEHRSFINMTRHQLHQSLTKNRDVISQICGHDGAQLTDVRPPNGLFTPQTLDWLQGWNYRPVMWSVVPVDWTRPGVNTVADRVLQQVQNGSVIVLHDGYSGGQDVAATVEQLIPLIRDRGYRFVTIDYLWQQLVRLNLEC